VIRKCQRDCQSDRVAGIEQKDLGVFQRYKSEIEVAKRFRRVREWFNHKKSQYEDQAAEHNQVKETRNEKSVTETPDISRQSRHTVAAAVPPSQKSHKIVNTMISSRNKRMTGTSMRLKYMNSL
jgi:hypothetical protein